MFSLQSKAAQCKGSRVVAHNDMAGVNEDRNTCDGSTA